MKIFFSTAIFLFLIATPKPHSPVLASKIVTSSSTHQFQHSYSPSFYVHRNRNPNPPAPSSSDDIDHRPMISIRGLVSRPDWFPADPIRFTMHEAYNSIWQPYG
ncbi:hypothetical protein RHGRI_034788 [Rhododendron griersonianum]|uniref:Uncharacterized protein n=1 Tax=Rhododendron griersonianum TaxID=479676 RepID=A0AAV6I247_9ERIC|nr:hypothetical protein RHGRI_034788 [Rhododendron griersonianum]